MCLFKNDQLTLVDVLLHAVAREDTHAKAAQGHQDRTFNAVDVSGTV